YFNNQRHFNLCCFLKKLNHEVTRGEQGGAGRWLIVFYKIETDSNVNTVMFIFNNKNRKS
ncbi:MAG: hypothetical protein WEA99_01405, partial [Brumimicrobium sp.]